MKLLKTLSTPRFTSYLITIRTSSSRTMSTPSSSSPAQELTNQSSSSSFPPATPPSSSSSTASAKPEEVATTEEEPSKFSVFGDGITQVHDVPMSVISRPIPSILDEEKVQTFMKEIQRGDTFTPVEILRVKNPTNPAQSYYYSLGGCHRYEAHKRLGRETIPGKIIAVPASTMKLYLGAGSPFQTTP